MTLGLGLVSALPLGPSKRVADVLCEGAIFGGRLLLLPFVGPLTFLGSAAEGL